jgi:hypothetical protein
MVRCPRCGYEFPQESRLLSIIGRWFRPGGGDSQGRYV